MRHLTRRSGWNVALVAALGGIPLGHAQGPTSFPPAASPAVTSASAPLPVPATGPDLTQLRYEFRQMQAAIKSDVARLRPAWWERLIPAGIGLAGVFVGGLLGWFQQGRQMKLTADLQQQQLRDSERIGRAKAGYESLSKVVEYQTKQVNEFYSPLRLMLLRSGGVRRQLTDQLQMKAPTRFTYVTEADNRDHLFLNEPDGTQRRFRLIEHMHELATSHAELMPLVQELLDIGTAMSDLVNTKGGMATTSSDRLTALLGRYLAHFSILRDVAKKAVAQPDFLPRLRYNVAYPVELDAALGEDMAKLIDQIEAWKQLSQRMWQEAQPPSAAADAAGQS